MCGVQFEQYEESLSWCKSKSTKPFLPKNERGLEIRFRDIVQDKDVDDSQTVALVFHGTRSINITNILQDGLDPAKRSGQAYGKGEYFSKDPSVCMSYCKLDKAIIVFLVVGPLRSKASRTSRKIPYDFVTVQDNRHQFPLGVPHFSKVDALALGRSQKIREQMKAARQKINDEVAATQDVQWKALIIQLLIQSKVDLAMEKYERFHQRLSYESKREISMYIHKVLDDDVIPCLFPDLSPPFDQKEFEQITSGGGKGAIHSLEWHTREVKKAKEDLVRIRHHQLPQQHQHQHQRQRQHQRQHQRQWQHQHQHQWMLKRDDQLRQQRLQQLQQSWPPQKQP